MGRNFGNAVLDRHLSHPGKFKLSSLRFLKKLLWSKDTMKKLLESAQKNVKYLKGNCNFGSNQRSVYLSCFAAE